MSEIDFLKGLTVLYAEDSKSVRTAMEEKIANLFNKFYVVNDGKEALELFIKLKEKKIKIDVIISDINMPNLDGIELLERIRVEDGDVPFLFTTAHFDKDYLKRAIDLNASEYILKPINIDDALNKIIRECKIRHQNEALKHQKDELEAYLKAIDNVATVTKTDIHGNIVFANKLFCEASKYNLDELLNKPHSIVRHPDMPAETFKILWKTIKSGKTWRGKLKNKAKDGSAYYANTTIIPRYDEFGVNIIEFISIRFITTEDELEKREFKRKVIQNMQETRKQKIEHEKYIRTLEEELKTTNHTLNKHLHSSLNSERKKVMKLYSQIEHYESEIKKTNTKYEKMIETSNEKIKKAFVYAKKLKVENEKFIMDIGCLKTELEEKQENLKKLQEMVSNQQKTIEDLKDVISFREGQLAVAKEKY